MNPADPMYEPPEVTQEDVRTNLSKRALQLAELITEARSSAALRGLSEDAYEIADELELAAMRRQDEELAGK